MQDGNVHVAAPECEWVIKTLRSSYNAKASGRDAAKAIGPWPNVDNHLVLIVQCVLIVF